MRRPARRLVGEVLVESAAGRPLGARLVRGLDGLTGTEVDGLLLAAARHGVTGLLGVAVEGAAGLPANVREPVGRAASRVLRDHLRGLGELATIAAALDDLDAPWLLLKGPALGQTSYPVPHLRESVDLDLLVPPSRLHLAVRQLTDAGCRLTDRAWADLRRDRAGEVRLGSPGGVPIDLHWRLMDDWRVRKAFRLPLTERLLERSVPVRLRALNVRALDPVDMVLHVALHACTSGGWRLSWLNDVTQSLRRAHGQEDELRARARSWQVELVLAAMVDRARRTLGLTDRAPDLRGRAAWLQLLAVVDALAPVERATGARSVTRIVTNSTRRTTAGSALELAQRTSAFTSQQVAARLSGSALR
jgi:hypothetical protein